MVKTYTLNEILGRVSSRNADTSEEYIKNADVDGADRAHRAAPGEKPTGQTDSSASGAGLSLGVADPACAECRMGESPERPLAAACPEHRERSDRPRSGEGGASRYGRGCCCGCCAVRTLLYAKSRVEPSANERAEASTSIGPVEATDHEVRLAVLESDTIAATETVIGP